MKRFWVAATILSALGGQGIAASAVNLDNEPRTLVVTEGGNQTELAVAAGETVEFCPSGCFVTMPNGDREALTGSETIEISGGSRQDQIDRLRRETLRHSSVSREHSINDSWQNSRRCFRCRPPLNRRLQVSRLSSRRRLARRDGQGGSWMLDLKSTKYLWQSISTAR